MSLPTLDGMELLGHAAQGQTLPLILKCALKKRPTPYQIKFASIRNGLSVRELACECVCTLLAQELGFHVSMPAVVRIGPELVAEIDSAYSMGIRDVHGAGVRWIPYLRPLVIPFDLEMSALIGAGRSEQIEMGLVAARLLAFDLITANGDRTTANANLAWDDDSLLVFDFEHCLELPGKTDEARFASHLQLLPNYRQSHILGPSIPPTKLRTAMAECLERLNSIIQTQPEPAHLPDSWRNSWREIVHYLEFICQRGDVIMKAASAEA